MSASFFQFPDDLVTVMFILKDEDIKATLDELKSKEKNLISRDGYDQALKVLHALVDAQREVREFYRQCKVITQMRSRASQN